MSFERVKASLDALQLKEQYLGNFERQAVTDSVVEECLINSEFLSFLDEMIPSPEHRTRFLEQFKLKSDHGESVRGGTSEEKISRPSEGSEYSSPKCNSLDSSGPVSDELVGSVNVSLSSLTLNPVRDIPFIFKKDEVQQSVPRPPEAIQIMNFKESQDCPDLESSPTVELFQSNLKRIVDQTKNPVAVLAIAGPTRKGKSFFLNYVLRYLHGLRDGEDDWMGWARSRDPLVGFPWRTAEDRVTTGIWMWSEPITLQSKDGPFDILLMDTQGVFDEHTTDKQWSILVGLGLITSSCLIFNIPCDLQEDQLQIFERFLSFGLLALKEKNGEAQESPFQDLVFLIRDWDRKQIYPLGSEGGRSFIDKKLEIKPQHRESHKKVRAQLRDCFEKIGCFLLPHPGSAALESSYNGSTSHCQVFLDSVEKCIRELMDPARFPIKKLNGNFLTGQDLLEHFTLYCNLMSSDEMPDPESFYEIQAKSCNSIVINKCLELFRVELGNHLRTRPFLPDDIVLGLQAPAEEKVWSLFTKSKKMGSSGVIAHSKQDLQSKLSEMFENFKGKNSFTRDKVISVASNEALAAYSNHMNESLASDFVPFEKLKAYSNEGDKAAVQLFKSQCHYENTSDGAEEVARLELMLKDRFSVYKNGNMLRQLETEKELDNEIQKLVLQYRAEMDFKTEGTIVSEAELKSLHSAVWEKCLQGFHAVKPHPFLLDKCLQKLLNRIKPVTEAIERSVQTCNENIQMAGEQLKANALQMYKDRVIAGMGICEDAFQKLHLEAMISARTYMEKTDRIKSKKCLDVFLKEFDKEVEDAHEELLQALQQQREDIKKHIAKARDDAVRSYVSMMDKLFSSQDPVEELKLLNRHDFAKPESEATLREFLEELPPNCRDSEEEEEILDELLHTLDNRFQTFVDVNNLRWSNFEAKCLNTLGSIKENYMENVRGVMGFVYEEEDFRKQEAAIRKETERELLQKVDTNLAKPEFLSFLESELENYIEGQFVGLLETFQMQQAEDEIQVKAAFLEAKKYYNEEMEKHVVEKEWFPPEVLKRLDEEITEAAIETCKEDIDLSESQEKQLREHMKNVFLKYEEENFRRYPKESYSVGIDLGTTYSCVAVYLNKQVKIIEYNGKGTVPSYVAFNEHRTIDVGESAKTQAYRRPENTIFDAKRLIGRKFTDPIVQGDVKLWPFHVVGDSNDQPRISVGGQLYRPEEISARILAKLKAVAEEYLLKPVLEAVVTVPAYFNDAQRQATRDAALIAGLKVRILNEPTAAAIAYGLHTPDDLKRNVLIFDLGGGTFDVGVLVMKGGAIDVKAIGGDTHLGGQDFDNEMVKYLIEKVKAKDGIDLGRDRDSLDPFKKRKAFERLGRIRSYCEQQKRLLSSANRTVISIDRVDENYDLYVEFTREDFERLNMPDFEKCIQIVKTTLQEANMDKSVIDDIVLVGGSTRIPKIREMLKDFFEGKKVLNIRINADEAVAYGAAVQAALLNGKQAVQLAHGISLSDVAPLSVGIENAYGGHSVVIPKNTPVPCHRSKEFVTAADNQTSASIQVHEGELPMAVDNNFLGKFVLSNIPPAPKGKEPVDINMNIDEEGILHVQAVSRNGKSTNSIDIQTYNGRMTESEISSARRDGLFNW